MNRLKILFILCATVLAVAAQARTEASFDFIKATNEIPASLVQAGYKKIGDLDLRKLLTTMQTIEVVEEDWVQTNKPEGAVRVFARWDRTAQGPRVTINKTMWDQAYPKFKAPLGLHEALGAAAFNDDDYSLSTALWLLNENARRDTFTRGERKYIEQRVMDLARGGGGGVIGVGGGGDLIGPGLKITLLMEAYDKYDHDPSDENRAHILQIFMLTQSFSIEGRWKQSHE